MILHLAVLYNAGLWWTDNSIYHASIVPNGKNYPDGGNCQIRCQWTVSGYPIGWVGIGLWALHVLGALRQ